MLEVKVRKFGNSLGIVLPKEVISRLRTGDGGVTPTDRRASSARRRRETVPCCPPSAARTRRVPGRAAAHQVYRQHRVSYRPAGTASTTLTAHRFNCR